MSAAVDAALDAIVRICGAGRFVPYFRNRPIGLESVRAECGAAGGLRVRAETEITIHRFALRQTAIVELSPDLRPRRCAVDAWAGGRRTRLEVEIEADGAVLRQRSGEQESATRRDLEHPPLLLLDNCFVSHALAALAVLRPPAGAPPFLSLPAGEALTVTRPGASSVLLGGRELPPPALSLHLAPDLDEHIWTAGTWVDRLVLPQAQMRVEWTADSPPPGGRP